MAARSEPPAAGHEPPAARHEPQAAKASKSSGVTEVCSDRHLQRADPSTSRLRGSICSFQLVRGTGDGEIARLAELQHGHVHGIQLRAAGISRNAVAHRVRAGRLHLALPGVYLVGRPGRDLLGRIMAAALYLKGDGLPMGRAAAHVWGMLDTTQTPADRDPIDVLVVGPSARTERNLRVHRIESLARQDVRWRRGVPLTSPARTILDLAATMEPLELESVLSAALRMNLVRRPNLQDVMERNRWAKGIGKLRMLLEQTESLRVTRSIYERKLLNLLRQAELPLPITNLVIDGKEIDGFWPDLQLAYEFDGWDQHREKFERDRLRDQQMLAVGHQTIRISGRQIDLQPYALIARLASIITARRLVVARTAQSRGPLRPGS